MQGVAGTISATITSPWGLVRTPPSTSPAHTHGASRPGVGDSTWDGAFPGPAATAMAAASAETVSSSRVMGTSAGDLFTTNRPDNDFGPWARRSERFVTGVPLTPAQMDQWVGWSTLQVRISGRWRGAPETNAGPHGLLGDPFTAPTERTNPPTLSKNVRTRSSMAAAKAGRSGARRLSRKRWTVASMACW